MADYIATVGVDLGPAIAEFRKLGPEAKKAFEQAAKAAAKAAKKVKPEADKMKKSVDDAGKKGKAAFMALKEGAEGFGGSIGGAVSAVEKFGKAVMESSTAGGAAGVALVGAGVAAVGYALAVQQVVTRTYEAIRAAGEWVDELEEAGIVIDRDVVAGIEKMNTSLDGLALQSKAAGVELVNSIIGPFQRAADSAGILLSVFGAYNEQTNLLTTTTSALGAAVAGLIPGLQTLSSSADLLEMAFPEAAAGMREFRDATVETKMALDLNKRSMFEVLDVSEALNTIRQEGAFLTREQTQAEKEAAEAQRAAEKAAQDRARAEREYFNDWLSQQRERARWIKDIQSMAENELREETRLREELNASLDRTNEQIERLAETYKEDLREAIIKVANEAGRLLGSFSALSAQQVSYRQDQLSLAQTERERLQEKIRLSDQAVEANREVIAAGKGEIDTTNVLSETEKKQLEARIQGLREAEANRKQAVLQAFRQEKQFSIVEATVNGAVAVTQALAAAPPPFNALLAAGVAASTGAQIALIQKQRPPTFPTGGMVGDKVDADHVLIGAQRNEAVLTGRGVDAAGGAAGVDALNSGRGRGPTHIEIHLPGVVIARSIEADRQVNRAIVRIVEHELRKKGL